MYGSFIKQCREARGLSQSDLSKLIHVEPNTVSHYENEKRKMSIDTFAKILEVLDYKIEVVDSKVEKVKIELPREIKEVDLSLDMFEKGKSELISLFYNDGFERLNVEHVKEMAKQEKFNLIDTSYFMRGMMSGIFDELVDKTSESGASYRMNEKDKTIILKTLNIRADQVSIIYEIPSKWLEEMMKKGWMESFF